jgi:hypothetical protein
MTDERYKKIMSDLGSPDSVSLLVALKQIANEVAQETEARIKAELKKNIPAFNSLWEKLKEGEPPVINLKDAVAHTSVMFGSRLTYEMMVEGINKCFWNSFL